MGRLNRLDSRTAIPQLEQMISEATAKVDELNNLLVDLDKLKAEIATKQPELISGKNIKTVNNNSLLGSGNIDIQGGGGGGTSDHSQLSNRDLPNQHPISAITNLQTSLNNKSNTGHTHEQYITEEEDPTVPSWAKEPTKPTYTAEEVGALPDDTVIPTVPTNVSAFTNDAGYITQNIKVLKRTTIPAYSYSVMTGYLEDYDEVIIVLNDVTYRYYGVSNDMRYFVATYYNKMEYLRQSTNGSWMKGSLTINNTTNTYSPTGTTAVTGQAIAQALATIDVPTKTSDLENDSGFITDISGKQDVITDLDTIRSKAENGQVAYETIENDLSDVAFTGDYNDLVNQPTIPSPTTVEQVLTSGTEIAKVNNVSLFAPQGGGGGITALDVYPVGAIYMSVSDVEPSTLFGGEWERIKDKFILSSGDTYSSGDEGGEATHTLTTTEMPSHNHAPITANYKFLESNANIAVNGTSRNFPSTGSSNHFVYSTATNAEIIEEATTKATGGGGSHNNMPPYLTVNVWKRTA